MRTTPDASLELELAGERVVLLGERALVWPGRSRLVIADLHLGKGHAFRRAGIAVPRGGTEHDLMRLAVLVETWAVRELWIVGDVLHGPPSGAEWRAAWSRWRQKHAKLDVAALTGNHDRALEGADLELRQLGHTQVDGPFAFRHLPQREATRHVIAGHVHPHVRVPGVPRNWPAFWLRPGLTVLPAFSAFTGGHVVQAARGESLIACVEDGVVPIMGATR